MPAPVEETEEAPPEDLVFPSPPVSHPSKRIAIPAIITKTIPDLRTSVQKEPLPILASYVPRKKKTPVANCSICNRSFSRLSPQKLRGWSRRNVEIFYLRGMTIFLKSHDFIVGIPRSLYPWIGPVSGNHSKPLRSGYLGESPDRQLVAAC